MAQLAEYGEHVFIAGDDFAVDEAGPGGEVVHGCDHGGVAIRPVARVLREKPDIAGSCRGMRFSRRA
jgi:hypothetical protein